MSPTEAPPRWKVLAAFAAVYLVWGSTYLAIRYAIETVPPFLMAGVRFTIAGLLLYGWSRWRGAPRPARVHWRSTAIVGGLLLLGGNGGVVWAEQRVPSGIAALIVAIVPVWIALLEWRAPGGKRPGWQVTGGLVAGTVGLGLLAMPTHANLGAAVDLVGAGVLVFATVSWAFGSILAKHSPLPASPLLATAMEMLMGGGWLILAGVATGELGQVHLAAVSARSWTALLYLITFGSLVGFTCYVWLLRVGSPTRAATYAYVNPVVAVFLGWAVAGEPISLRTVLAMLVIVGAVVLITSTGIRRGARSEQRVARSEERVMRSEEPGTRSEERVVPSEWRKASGE